MSGKKLKTSFGAIFQEYMAGKVKLKPYQQVGIIFLVWVFAGVFGWVYEFIFYFFDGGTGEFYMQGGNFLPWINIYAVGAIMILVLMQLLKIKKYPWLVFVVALVATGILEFVSGWLVYVIGNGTRYWDYNTEIWNFGNIGGFVCLRSVLAFGVSALMLVYLVVPFFVMLAQRMSRWVFLTLAILLFSLVMVDEVYNLLASKFFGWPDAMEFYKSLGWKYLT
ncbi:putative ABC transporter permease [Candidatus Saccharibacteria bacterium]|nr:putative ABC transporter permease [Candidatus Saccharibacteria bacterium]